MQTDHRHDNGSGQQHSCTMCALSKMVLLMQIALHSFVLLEHNSLRRKCLSLSGNGQTQVISCVDSSQGMAVIIQFCIL